MKKSLICSLSLCLIPLTGSLHADRGLSVEGRVSAFFPLSQCFRDAYGDVGACYGIEVSKTFCKSYDAWVDADYFTKERYQDGCCSSEVDIVNTSIGARYRFGWTPCLTSYVGIGPGLSWLYFKNKSCCDEGSHTKLVAGLVVKTGIFYQFYKCYFVDLFVDYSYLPVKFESTIDIGGFKTGLGLGMRF